jgi:DNA-binding NarL/FixJ family response regulator
VPRRSQGSTAIPNQLREAGVTVREFEVLTLVADRLGNREISERLFLSPRTVEKHVASLFVKMGAPDRTVLIRRFHDIAGRLDPPVAARRVR